MTVKIIEIGLHICESYEILVRHRKGPNTIRNHNPRIFAMADLCDGGPLRSYEA